jgi:hypothetical protein
LEPFPGAGGFSIALGIGAARQQIAVQPVICT